MLNRDILFQASALLFVGTQNSIPRGVGVLLEGRGAAAALASCEKYFNSHSLSEMFLEQLV